jgi:hypothetical protein
MAASVREEKLRLLGQAANSPLARTTPASADEVVALSVRFNREMHRLFPSPATPTWFKLFRAVDEGNAGVRRGCSAPGRWGSASQHHSLARLQVSRPLRDEGTRYQNLHARTLAGGLLHFLLPIVLNKVPRYRLPSRPDWLAGLYSPGKRRARNPERCWCRRNLGPSGPRGVAGDRPGRNRTHQRRWSRPLLLAGCSAPQASTQGLARAQAIAHC